MASPRAVRPLSPDLAISLASMTPQARVVVQMLLDVIEDRDSCIAALNATVEELQGVVRLLAHKDGSLVRH